MKRYCFALDLYNDPKLIAEYEAHHRQVWPEIAHSIKAAGIEHMEIYRFADRLFMIMDVNDTFDAAQKVAADAANEKVQEWERLMWQYQKPLPQAKPGEKWVLMDRIFNL